MTTPRSNVGRGEPQPTKMRFLLTLVTWLFIGPVGMLLTLMTIVQRGTGWTTGHDVIFFVLLAASVTARWIDAINGDPVTSGGEAVGTGNARRYTIWLVGLGLASWVAANVIGNHVLH